MPYIALSCPADPEVMNFIELQIEASMPIIYQIIQSLCYMLRYVEYLIQVYRYYIF